MKKDNNKKYLLFRHSYFSNSRLYTYFTYNLITYLSRHQKTHRKFLIKSEELTDVLTVLYSFISDYKTDFFRFSLKQILPLNFQFYMLDFNSELWRKCK